MSFVRVNTQMSNNFLFFKILFGSKIIYEIWAINIGSFFGNVFSLWIFNIMGPLQHFLFLFFLHFARMGRNNLPPNNKIEKYCQLLSIIVVVDWPKAKSSWVPPIKKNPVLWYSCVHGLGVPLLVILSMLDQSWFKFTYAFQFCFNNGFSCFNL